MFSTQRHHPIGQHGFTLIEVLIAVVIIAIGLLGLAGLNAVGINSTHTSHLRSLASIHTENMADMMRANISGVDANDYANNAAPATIDYSTITGAGAPGIDCRPDVTGTAFSGGSTACTPAEQAQVDAFNWVTAIANDLPAGTGTVICNDSDGADADPCTNGSTFTITVSWQEKDKELANLVTKSFSTVFRP
jgi:type IV pilus assembly protein PilV